MDPANFTVVPASPSQKDALTAAAYDAWSSGMSRKVPVPVEFQNIIDRAHAEGGWAKDQGDITWVLVRKGDLEGEIYSGCESHRTQGFFKRKGSDQLEEGHYYGLTAVVTPIHHRRKGYASHLMRLLHYTLAGPSSLPPFPSIWGSTPPPIPAHLQAHLPKAICSILFSTLSPDFYEKCTIGLDKPGWVAKADNQGEMAWKVLPAPSQHEYDDNRDRIVWTRLYDTDIPEIAQILSVSVKSNLLSTSTTSHGIFTPNPASPGSLTFLSVRGGFSPQPTWTQTCPHSAQIRGLRSGSTIILLARYNEFFTSPSRLMITYIHNLDLHPTGSDNGFSSGLVESLLAELDILAVEAELFEGVAWGLTEEVVEMFRNAGGRDVRRRMRVGKEDLLGVAWYEGGEWEFGDSQMWVWM